VEELKRREMMGDTFPMQIAQNVFEKQTFYFLWMGE
jgi:hypothetical protein